MRVSDNVDGRGDGGIKNRAPMQRGQAGGEGITAPLGEQFERASVFVTLLSQWFGVPSDPSPRTALDGLYGYCRRRAGPQRPLRNKIERSIRN
jgi:hypothetical protein